MRIAVVHSFYSSDSPSGENIAVEHQVDALRAAGHDVQLLERRTDLLRDRKAYSLAAAVTAATGYGYDPSAELRTFDPEIVHVHNLFPNFGAVWLRHFRERLVVTMHNYRPLCSNGTLSREGKNVCTECLTRGSQRAVRHGCYRGSRIATIPLAIASRDRGRHNPVLTEPRAIVVLNDKARDRLREVTSARIEVVPNFVDEGIGKVPRRSRWLYVGRLSHEKGILHLLNGFPAHEELAILGDGPLRSVVQKAANASSGRIRYYGLLRNAVARKHIAAATGLIFPSQMPEGLPTVLLEAAAAGTPCVVSTNCEGAAPIVEGGGGEWYRPRNGPLGLQTAMRQVSAERTRYGYRARQVYRQFYSRDAWLERIEGVYGRIRATSVPPHGEDSS